MKLLNSIGNATLICAGAVGLLMLLPSDNGASAGGPHTLRSTLATSPKLAHYLQARLQTAPVDRQFRVQPPLPEPVQPPVVDSAPLVVAATDTLSYGGYDTRSRTALNVREGPSTEHATLFVLQPDIGVRVEEVSGGWARISASDGSTGWAFAKYLTGASAQLAERTSAGETRAAPKAKYEKTKETVVARTEVVAKKQAGASTAAHSEAQAFRLANTIPMRSSPSTTSPRLSTVPAGSKLRVVERNGRWARVILMDGTSGWINVR